MKLKRVVQQLAIVQAATYDSTKQSESQGNCKLNSRHQDGIIIIIHSSSVPFPFDYDH